jgi:anti-sigma regulatory factor (Ser/Thr protein kinase)
MNLAGYGTSDRFAVRMALEGAAINAVNLGHRGDSSKLVGICWGITSSGVKLVVRDKGPDSTLRVLPIRACLRTGNIHQAGGSCSAIPI